MLNPAFRFGIKPTPVEVGPPRDAVGVVVTVVLAGVQEVLAVLERHVRSRDTSGFL